MTREGSATTNARRAEIDRLRGKADDAYQKLWAALDEDGHDEDCVLRCLLEEICFQEHSCIQCSEDGEV